MSHRKIQLVSIGILLMAILFFIMKEEIVITTYVLKTDRLGLVQGLETHYLYWIHHAFAFIPVWIISLIGPHWGMRAGFYKTWLLPIVLGSMVFLAWDIYFSYLSIWGFNERYLTGNRIANFPLEEVVWFPVIGCCSLYIYFLMEREKWALLEQRGWVLAILVCFGLFLFWMFYFDRLYSSFAVWSIFIVIWLWYWSEIQDKLMNFMGAFMIITLPMLIMDGMLTGIFTQEALIIYNPSENSGIRIISIPIEDFLFGFSFLAFIVWIKNVINKRLSAN